MATERLEALVSARLTQFEQQMRKTTEIIEREARRSSQSMDRLNKSVGFVESSIKKLGTALLGLGLGAVIRNIAQATLEAQSLSRAMASAAGGAAEGRRELEFVRQTADQLGLNFRTLAQQYTGLLAATKTAGKETDVARLIFRGTSEAVAAMGLSNEKAERTFTALQQIMGKQKLAAEELTGQLGEQLVVALGVMAEALEIDTQKLFELQQQGRITADALIPFAEKLREKFGKQAAEAAQSARAQFERFNNAVNDLMVSIGESGLLNVLGAVAQMMAQRIFPEIQRLVQVFQLAATALGDFALMGQTASGALGKGFLVVVRGIANAMVIVGGAVSLAVEGFLALHGAWESFNEKFITGQRGQAWKDFLETIDRINKQIESIKNLFIDINAVPIGEAFNVPVARNYADALADIDLQYNALQTSTKELEKAEKARQKELDKRHRRILDDLREEQQKAMEAGEQRVEAAVRVIEKRDEQHEKLQEQLNKEAEAYKKFGDRVQRTLEESIFDVISGRVKDAEDLFKRLRDTFLRILSQMAAASLREQLFPQTVTGTRGGGGGIDLSAVGALIGGLFGGGGVQQTTTTQGGTTTTTTAGAFNVPSGQQQQQQRNRFGLTDTQTAGLVAGAGVASGTALRIAQDPDASPGEGAAAGATEGAAIGSLFGPQGAVIGAASGALIGSIIAALTRKKKPRAAFTGFDPGFGIGIAGFVESDLDIMLNRARSRRIGSREEKEFLDALNAMVGGLVGEVTNVVNDASPEIREAAIGPLAELGAAFGRTFDDIEFKSRKNLVEKIERFINETLPETFDHIFGAFTKAVSMAQNLDDAISSLEAAQSQTLGTIADVRRTVFEATMTPAAIFERRRADLSTLLSEYEGLSPANRIGLVPALTQMVNDVFSLAQQQNVLGSDRGALLAFQTEMLAILDRLELDSREAFGEQISITEGQLNTALDNLRGMTEEQLGMANSTLLDIAEFLREGQTIEIVLDRDHIVEIIRAETGRRTRFDQ